MSLIEKKSILVSRICSKSAEKKLICANVLTRLHVAEESLVMYTPKTCLVLMGFDTLKDASFEHDYQKAFIGSVNKCTKGLIAVSPRSHVQYSGCIGGGIDSLAHIS